MGGVRESRTPKWKKVNPNRSAVSMGGEAVVFHAGDVLLDDGLDLPLHERQLWELVFLGQEIVFEFKIVFEVVNADEVVAVVLNHEVVEVIHGRAIAVIEDVVDEVGATVEDVFAEREIGLLVIEQCEERRRDVGLLDEPGGIAFGIQLSAGRVEEDGNQESPHFVVVVLAEAGTTMVGGEDEDGVVEPRLSFHLFKVLPNGVVGVTDGLVHGDVATREGGFVLIGDGVGIVARRGEDGQEKRLVALGDFVGFVGEVLEVWLVEDRPGAVKIFVAIFIFSVIVLKSDGVGEPLESQCGVGRAMEECRGISLVPEHFGEPLQGVVGIEKVAVGVDVAGDAGEACGHAVDRTNAIGKAVLEAVAFFQQGVEELGVALVCAAILVLVVEPGIFHGEALHDEDHHVEFLHLTACRMLISDRVEDAVQFFLGEELRVFVASLVNGGEQRERRVQYDGRLQRLFAVNVGGILSQGVHFQPETASQSSQREQHRDDEEKDVRWVVNDVFSIIVLVFVLLDGVIVEKDDAQDHQDSEKPHFPVASHAVQENLAQIALSAELRKDGRRGSTSAELEVNDIRHVDHDSEDVDDEENDFDHFLVLHRIAVFDGQELEEDANQIQVAERAQVKTDSTPRDGHYLVERDILEAADVHVIKEPPREHVNHHHQQKIDDHDETRLFSQSFKDNTHLIHQLKTCY